MQILINLAALIAVVLIALIVKGWVSIWLLPIAVVLGLVSFIGHIVLGGESVEV